MYMYMYYNIICNTYVYIYIICKVYRMCYSLRVAEEGLRHVHEAAVMPALPLIIIIIIIIINNNK